MPTIFSAGAASSQGFGSQLAPLAPFNIGVGNTFQGAQATAVDSSSNQIFATLDPNNGRNFILKIDPFGSVLWSYDYGGNCTPLGLACDSNNNIYITYTTSIFSSDPCIMKLTTNGTFVAATHFNVTTAGYSNLSLNSRIAIDSSGNIYVSGYGVAASSASVAVMTKFDSSLAITWSNAFTYTTGATTNNVCNDHAVDASGNVFMLNQALLTSSGFYITYVTKLASNGSVSASCVLNVSASLVSQCIGIDSIGNVFLVAFNVLNSIYKLTNSLGTLSAQLNLNGPDASSATNNMSFTIAPDNTVYMQSNGTYTVSPYGSRQGAFLGSISNTLTNYKGITINVDAGSGTNSLVSATYGRSPTFFNNVLYIPFNTATTTNGQQPSFGRIPVSYFSASGTYTSQVISNNTFRLYAGLSPFTSSPGVTLSAATSSAATWAMYNIGFTESQFPPGFTVDSGYFTS